jgi:iron complex outermembrane receptor protein
MAIVFFLYPIPTTPAQSSAAKSNDYVDAGSDQGLDVVEQKNTEKKTPNTVTGEDMEKNNANDLQQAVQYVPGVVLTGGGNRNDSNFTVRGFGSDSVPIYLDGVPVSDPYKGEGDAGRFLTGGLESVEIQKGFSSELMGANTLGGAVFLRTAKPKKKLETEARESVDFDSRFHYGNSSSFANIGTKLKYFYGKASFQYRDVNHFRLSSGFTPVDLNPQKVGDRLYSSSNDMKVSAMAGVTPLPGLDIWLNYSFQNSHKNVSPPQIRIAQTNSDFVLWNWPKWQRHTVSLNGEYTGKVFMVSGLFYFDKYDNRLDVYNDIQHYNLGIHQPHSDYDEYSLGARLTGSWDINNKNTIAMALNYKKDSHKGLQGGYSGTDENVMSEVIRINEDTWSLGAEYTLRPIRPLTIKAGLGFNALVPVDYWGEEEEFAEWVKNRYYIVKTDTRFLWTWQAGVFWNVKDTQQVRFTYARKNHFPTMSDRYSTRFGQNLPNPSLGPEIANHFELGWNGSFLDKIHLDAAFYYSLLTGKIVQVKIPDPSSPSTQLNYPLNLDETSFYGAELAASFKTAIVSGGASFSWNGYYLNHAQSTVDNLVKVIPYYPALVCSQYLVITPISKPPKKARWLRTLAFTARFTFIGSRFGDSAGDEPLGGYCLVSLKAEAQITKYLTLSLAIDNLLDSYYEMSYNYPMPGRTFNMTLTARY